MKAENKIEREVNNGLFDWRQSYTPRNYTDSHTCSLRSVIVEYPIFVLRLCALFRAIFNNYPAKSRGISSDT